MSTIATAALAGLATGLVGQLHCFGMCGGITGALALRAGQQPHPGRWLLLANIGRLGGYLLVGVLAGTLGATVVGLFPQAGPVLRGFAALMLVLVALQVLGVPGTLHWLERLTSRLAPLLRHLGQLPVPAPMRPLLLGMAWGLLPCGLVYAAAALAMGQQGPLAGAATMLGFGLGTLPGVLALGGLGRLLHSRPWARRGTGLATLAMAVWIVLPTIVDLHQHTPDNTGHHQHHANHG